jgi:hypothetical protein
MFYREGIEHQWIHPTELQPTTAKNPSIKSPLRLGYALEQRFSLNCNVTLRNDYTDYFSVTKAEGWLDATLPSDAERNEYGTTGYHGLVILCPMDCRLHRDCGEGEIINEWWMLDFQVNGMDAVGESLVARSLCVILRHRDVTHGGEPFRFQANSEGRYDLRVRINPDRSVSDGKPSSEEKSVARISSIIIL